PEFLARLQRILNTAGLRVHIENPYQLKTKGEMLLGCANQKLLRAEAATSTSCGRFQRFKYTHCGRCVPCQVRRAAFLAWGVPDTTPYVYEHLGRDDANHAGFDDVRSVAMAIAQVREDGLDDWIGPALSSSLIGDVASLKTLVQRGLDELNALHQTYGVR
ncbi:MAG TPA: 7-cyano-7-deazaguanine synthase, partial [Longimicrobiaceae bacterium]|nr:7-cyano-7-deazaguanine synthase [Longimicrobiaceae bacterium]